MIEMRSLYDGKGDEVSQKTGLRFHDEKGRPLAVQYVKQSELEASKIDNILARYAQAGLNPFIDPITAGQVYGRKITQDEYMAAANLVADAKSQFEMLGAEVRARFNHNISEFLEFASQEDNALELAHLISDGTKVDAKGRVIGEGGKPVDYASLVEEMKRPKDAIIDKESQARKAEQVAQSKPEQVAQSKPAEAGVPKKAT